MSTYAVIRVLVFLLVLVPFAAAVLVPLFGRAARRVSLNIAFLHFGLTAAVVTVAIPTFGYREDEPNRVTPEGLQRFRPEFVPGDPGGLKQSEGADNRTSWTLFQLSANERSCSASYFGAIVMYGRSQSPSTPRRLKSSRWPLICDCANSRHA